jgi:hypothetical protein
MSEQHQSLREIIGIAIGEASMCWSETPTGVFDSSRAKEICDRVVQTIERRVYLESMIKGHMEAMRPLLDEWSGRL